MPASTYHSAPETAAGSPQHLGKSSSNRAGGGGGNRKGSSSSIGSGNNGSDAASTTGGFPLHMPTATEAEAAPVWPANQLAHPPAPPPRPLPSQRWLAGSAAVMPAPRHRRVFATLVAVNGATAAPVRDDGGTGGSSGGGSGGDGGGDSPDAQSCGGSARVGWSGHCCIGAITRYRVRWAHGA